jgi:hypothetical protein
LAETIPLTASATAMAPPRNGFVGSKLFKSSIALPLRHAGYWSRRCPAQRAGRLPLRRFTGQPRGFPVLAAPKSPDCTPSWLHQGAHTRTMLV